LPADIAIRHLTTTYSTFHPRFEAKWRQYRYIILNQPVRSPLWARTAHHVVASLDVDAMAEASQVLVGSYDFAAFGKPPQGDSTVRHVLQSGWAEEHPRGITGKLLVFDIAANAFLYRMVRNIVGTLVRVGQGELSPEGVAGLLRSKDRAASGPPAPSCGLCLVKVAYPEDG
jgi:tRNA pseudouridine38-40 synthase